MTDEVRQMLENNRRFVENKEYEQFRTSGLPDKKIAVVTCMDTRLVQLLPAALGIRNGDVKMIKNAGGMITDPYDSTVRSLLIAIGELGVEEIMIVGHTQCGVAGLDADELIEALEEKGVSEENIAAAASQGIDLKGWLGGFDHVEDAVCETVDLLRSHPLIPESVEIDGYVIEIVTGELRPVAGDDR